jgi:phage major head subunit gpT-like protein
MITDYGVKGQIYKALAETPSSDKLATLAVRVDSNLPAGSSEKLDFIGMVPALREWIGGRNAKRPLAYKPTVLLKKFESTIDIPLDWVNNDKTGQVAQASGQLVRRYNPQWAAARVAALINAGATDTTGIDGKAFFADDHVWGDSGTIDNNLSHAAATGTSPTANEAADSIVEAYNALTTFKDDRGEPMNEDITEVTIVVQAGTATAAAVAQAAVLDNLDTGAGVRNNPVKGLPVKINIVASTRITLGEKYVMVNASPNACPFVMLENKADFAITQKGRGSDYEHDNDAWQYGIKAVGEAGYGRFTDVVLMTFT